jgi:CBS domain-containing protein
VTETPALPTETPLPAAEVTAADVMSNAVVAVTVDHSLGAAWEAMRDRRVHHVAVLDEDGLVAVLDERTVAAHWPAGGPETPHHLTVGGTARRGVRCVLPDAPVAEVARIMTSIGCDAVPVATRSGVLLGLVTATDVVAAVACGAVDVAVRAVGCDDGSHA